ncbi:nitroreductase [Tatumella morbirosei]|uniref:Nitroreductase n=1 Tax=Tatumella morbirosei TaxID=642227 RepID=A0A095UL14_9GAMM|nr:nitroreductase family protein [Tatumella morbirosei]KGD75128.1 nitroreductase [Tatumella morbirosei]
MSQGFNELSAKRRTIYALGPDLPLTDDEVISLIQTAIKNAPSAFNSQSSRALILLGDQHKTFWSLTKEQLRKHVPAEAFEATDKKINGFAAAAGSVLFFEDKDVVTGLQQKFAAYADNFPVWSEHSTGIAQYAVWLALAEQGIGANLQHYNPLVDEDVRNTWNVPASWKLRAQLNFGSVEAPAGEKTYIADNERFIIAR